MRLNGSRDVFFERIGERLEAEDIFIVSADLAGRPFDQIRKVYPERYISVGIAEQNMISVACGIALCGKKVIAYASNPFVVFRAFDQIRNCASLMGLPIAIAGVGVGFGSAAYGPTHFVTEDFAMMSLCPNMEIITVTDDTIADYALERFLHLRGPLYLRFDKSSPDNFCGKWDLSCGYRYMREGEENLILSSGYTVPLALEQQSDSAVIDVFSYPFTESGLLEEIKKYKKVFVFEEQQRRGGLGSLILEMLTKNRLCTNIELVGIDYDGHFPSTYGSRDYWLNKYRLYEEFPNKN